MNSLSCYCSELKNQNQNLSKTVSDIDLTTLSLLIVLNIETEVVNGDDYKSPSSNSAKEPKFEVRRYWYPPIYADQKKLPNSLFYVIFTISARDWFAVFTTQRRQECVTCFTNLHLGEIILY